MSVLQEHDIYSGLGEDASDIAYQRGAASKDNAGASDGGSIAAEESRRSQALQRARCIVETLDGVKVSFLQTGVDDLEDRAAFTHFFDVVHLSASTAHHINDENFTALLAEHARVVVETAKYVVPLSKEQEASYNEKIVEYSEKRGFKLSPGLSNLDHIVFEKVPVEPK